MYCTGITHTLVHHLALKFENHNVWAQHLEVHKQPKWCTCISLSTLPDLGWHAPKCIPALLNGLELGMMFHNQNKADVQLYSSHMCTHLSHIYNAPRNKFQKVLFLVPLPHYSLFLQLKMGLLHQYMERDTVTKIQLSPLRDLKCCYRRKWKTNL
jgi:hypothetical protein